MLIFNISLFGYMTIKHKKFKNLTWFYIRAFATILKT